MPDQMNLLPDGLSLPPMASPTSRSDLVAEAIKAAILSGRLQPGQPLVEREVSQALGVSKTPVREALIRLSRTGLVATSSYRGMIVRRVDQEMVRSLYEVRLLLEPEAVRRAGPHHDRRSLRELEGALLTAAELADQEAWPELSQENRRFHRLLYAPCPNELHRSILDGLQDQVSLVAVAGWRHSGSHEIEAREHRAILDAITEGEHDLAGTLAYDHMSGFWDRLVRSLETDDA